MEELREKSKYLVSVSEAMHWADRGRAGLMKDAAAAGAVIRAGRLIKINLKKLAAFYDALSGE